MNFNLMNRDQLLELPKEKLIDMILVLLERRKAREAQVEDLKRRLNLMALRTMDYLPEIEDDRS